MFILAVIVIVTINGIRIKLGPEREFNFGGVRGLLAKKDEDVYLKENLKRFTDDVDHEIQADLFEFVEEIDRLLEKVLVNKHCYFTMEKFSNIIKRELQKRLRRNNLREKLLENNRDYYIEDILKNVEKNYALFQKNVAATSCDDKYADFPFVKDAMGNVIGQFYDYAKKRHIEGWRKKRAEYKKEAPNFKTVSGREFCCDRPDLKNKGYIESFTGKPEPAGTWYRRKKEAA
jgi:hypothetical protein